MIGSTAAKEEPKNGRVLALLWHAPHRVITAGGFRRTYEIFRRTPPGVQVLALDDAPSFLLDIANPGVSVREYSIPRPVRALEGRCFRVERAIEWALAAAMMTWSCLVLAARRERFDAILVPSSEQLPALVAGIAGKYALRCPLVLCNLNIDIFPEALRGPIAWAHNFADTVIAISSHLSGELRRHGVKAPVEINTVGLDCAAIDAVPAPPEKRYDAVFVGRHDTEKGVFDLLPIWAEVAVSVPGARLAMVGSSNPTNRARIEATIEALGIRDNVALLGMVDDRTKYATIKGSKVCLFPSYVEEWGIVPQEALACGLPVVAYDLPVYQENIAPCEAVFRERKGDVQGMAAATVRLLDGARYREYADIGPAFVRRFGWDGVARREFEIALGRDGSGRPEAAGRGNPGRAGGQRLKRFIDMPPAVFREAFKRGAVAFRKAFAFGRTFDFEGRSYRYFYHPYNLAWRNERAVEVPIALGFLEGSGGKRVLEVGNVLSHYVDVSHDVVDKYEKAPGVINVDAVEFDPGRRYDLVVSISTLEHIGADEEPARPGAALEAVENLKRLLAPGGKMIATVPVGLNEELDRVLFSTANPFEKTRALKRRAGNTWQQVDPGTVRRCRYRESSFRADAILVLETGRERD